MRTDIEVEVILNKEEMELVLGFSAPAVWDQPRSKESEFKEFQYKGETYFFLVNNGTLHIFDCAGDEEFSVQYKSVDEPATDVLHLLMNAYAKFQYPLFRIELLSRLSISPPSANHSVSISALSDRIAQLAPASNWRI